MIGPSGCGKSTLFDVIAGLERPDAGRVLVDGADATGHVEHAAYMPQRDLLFPWRTVLDNTTLGLEVAGVRRRAARARAQPLFAPFGLAGFEHARPDALSGGMRQRAALLRTVPEGAQERGRSAVEEHRLDRRRGPVRASHIDPRGARDHVRSRDDAARCR